MKAHHIYPLIGVFVATMAVANGQARRAPEKKVRVPMRVIRTPVRGMARIPNREFTAIRLYPAVIKPIAINKINLPFRDLRPTIEKKGFAIRNQGGRGTCSMFAITFLLEYMYGKSTATPFQDLSEEYLNYVTNLAAKNKGDGDFFANIDSGYQTYGIVPEKQVPYQATYDPNLQVKPEYIQSAQKWKKFAVDFIKPWDSSKGASQAQLNQAVDYLNKDIPVAAGFLWPKQIAFKTQGTQGVDLMVVPKREDTFDGHSVALVGYARNNTFPGGGYFIFRNSGGPIWGDKGYGYMPFDYVLKYANDLVAYH